MRGPGRNRELAPAFLSGCPTASALLGMENWPVTYLMGFWVERYAMSSYYSVHRYLSY